MNAKNNLVGGGKMSGNCPVYENMFCLQDCGCCRDCKRKEQCNDKCAWHVKEVPDERSVKE